VIANDFIIIEFENETDEPVFIDPQLVVDFGNHLRDTVRHIAGYGAELADSAYGYLALWGRKRVTSTIVQD
jgi:hypothetical protein